MNSRDITASNFSLTIAYLLPGFTALQGVPFWPSTGSGWGTAGAGMNATVSDFLSGTVEAVFAGLTASTVRWLVIDTVHHRTGVTPPRWDFAALSGGVGAFEVLIQIHYQYYKFYANMVVALAWAYASGGYALGWKGLGYWVLALLFFFGSRDTLRKYYERAGRLLSPGP